MKKQFPYTDEKGRFKRRSPFRPPGLGERPNLVYEYKGVNPPNPSGWTVSRKKLGKLDAEGEIEWVDGKPWRKQRPAEGIVPNNIWTDINTPTGRERLGYATQKPLALLERIIKASTNESDVILDPFCGCATTLEAAHKLGRKWIGIDIAIHAIKLVAKRRLEEDLHLVEGKKGIPQTLEGAKDLWKRDKYQFQKWCVEVVDGFVTSKKTADGGIDGRIYFDDPEEEAFQSMVVEVKGGKNVSIHDVRALHSVMEHDDARMAGLIVMEPLNERKLKNFHRYMAQSGDLIVSGRPFPRMQILTVEQILKGAKFDTPFPEGKEKRQLSMDFSAKQSSP